MQYSRSSSTEYTTYAELFPTRYSIHFSKLQAGTDTSIANMFLRRAQPRPQIIAIPPPALPQWITWCIQETVNAGINPTYYTDGSYAEEPTIQTIFKTDTLKRTASASVIVKDSSQDWANHPIIILRITDGAEVGSKYVYPMEFLALAAAMWISKEGGHRAPHNQSLTE